MQDGLRLSRDEIIICYKDDVARLMRYLSWLQEKSGTVTSGIYKGEGIEKSSMTVPVYDSTLLSFIKEAKKTDFINRNYVYTYSRYRMKTPQCLLFAGNNRSGRHFIEVCHPWGYEGRSVVRGCSEWCVSCTVIKIKRIDGNQETVGILTRS